MAGIDKAAIAFSIAIVAVGVGIAFSMGAAQDAAPVVSTPSVATKTVEPKAQADPFADIADKVKQEAPKVEEKMMEKPQEKPVEKTVKVEEKMKMVEEKPKEKAMEKPAGPTTHSVDIPVGTSVPGCEESNACYLPADITINAGDTVNWVNIDSAAHTVTGGSPADGPSGVFDSSLVMASAEYAFTFNDSGSYDYFCMVHPWMVGSVTVN
ncbi:plastocyanin/azurin family copper-binding protein [Nitrosopumilus adriaticus]|uniref:Blue (Type1) copper domain-containing protein n=1 Tax=Nitrosopumilus adriaticus TaxID=1580092 RepID=A0A0D5C186_9ARCH|nr:plastocyanin/azurin family copper-binding protein [Nitrosopumilus adriaticus]AJW70481.1 Blue (Type1) copper domain-containing protein [Nitrosopumilus adriaticus]